MSLGCGIQLEEQKRCLCADLLTGSDTLSTGDSRKPPLDFHTIHNSCGEHRRETVGFKWHFGKQTNEIGLLLVAGKHKRPGMDCGALGE